MQNARIASGMSLGARKSAASGSMNETSGLRAAASADHVSQSIVCPAWFHTRRHSCTSHRPAMFFNSRIVSAHAAFVGEVELRALVVDHRRGDSTPISDHVPRLM